MRHNVRIALQATGALVWVTVAGQSCGRGITTSVTPLAPPGSPCVMADADRRWLRSAFAGWQRVVTRLALPDDALPDIVAFDARCEFRVARYARPDAPLPEGREHGARLFLPDSGALIPGAIAVTSLAGGAVPFVVIGLRDVWIAADTAGDRGDGLNAFLTRALVHELTHTQQLPGLSAMLLTARRRLGLDTLGDDAVQERFASVRGFERQVEEEIDLLFRAVLAPTIQEQRRLLWQAVAAIRSRRARYFSGELAPWADVEQAFFDLEGAAQWAALYNLRATTYRRMPGAELLRKFRVNGRFWSEEEGLGLYLALDALTPEWPVYTFGPQPTSSLVLLERALAGSLEPRRITAMKAGPAP